MEALTLEEAGILSNLLRGQRRDSDGATGALGLQGGGGRRRADGHWWRRRNACGREGGAEAIESRKGTLLESYFACGFAAGLGMADESEDDAKASWGKEAPILPVSNLPDL